MGWNWGWTKNNKAIRANRMKRSNQIFIFQPNLYNIMIDYPSYRYKRTIIKTFFSYFTLEEVANLSRLSRRFYYITGLQEVLENYVRSNKSEDKVINCATDQKINNTSYFCKNDSEEASPENNYFTAYDIIADEFGDNMQMITHKIIVNSVNEELHSTQK